MVWKRNSSKWILALAVFCSLFTQGSTFLWNKTFTEPPLFFHDETLNIFFEEDKVYIPSATHPILQDMTNTSINTGFVVRALKFDKKNSPLCSKIISYTEGFLKIIPPSKPIDSFFQCDTQIIALGGESIVYHFFFNRTFKSWAVEGNVPPKIQKTVSSVLNIFHESHYTEKLHNILNRVHILNLSNHDVRSMAPLGSLLNLRVVRLARHPVKRLEPLRSLPALQILTLSQGCEEIEKNPSVFSPRKWKFINKDEPYSSGKPACFIMNKALVEGQTPSLTL